MWLDCPFRETTEAVHIYKAGFRFMLVGGLLEDKPVPLFGVIVRTDFVQDCSFHLSECPSGRAYIGRHKVNDHPLLVPSLCCLSVPILYLLADGHFVRFNVLGEGIRCPNTVFSTERTSHIST